MYIIVGLGNPGLRFEKTRHNVGFRVIDKLAAEYAVRVNVRKFRSLIGDCVIDGNKVLLVKPQTYMNLSGEAVREVASYYHIEPDHLIVIYDDLDLPLGSLRIRKSGGPGTHNGMRSVVSCLGNGDFPRIRVGIGDTDDAVVDHVIGKVPKAEQEVLAAVESDAARAVTDIIVLGIDNAMNRHNFKKGPTQDDH